jgi:hypothetical protein
MEIVNDTTLPFRPALADKFKQQDAEKLIREILAEKLKNQTYSSETGQALAKDIADLIKARLKGSCKLRNH